MSRNMDPHKPLSVVQKQQKQQKQESANNNNKSHNKNELNKSGNAENNSNYNSNHNKKQNQTKSNTVDYNDNINNNNAAAAVNTNQQQQQHQHQSHRQQRSSISPCIEQQQNVGGGAGGAAATTINTSTLPKSMGYHAFTLPRSVIGAGPSGARNVDMATQAHQIYPNGAVYINNVTSNLHGWHTAPQYIHGDMPNEQSGPCYVPINAGTTASHKGPLNGGNGMGGNRPQRRSRGGRGGGSYHLGRGRNDYHHGHNHQSNLSHQHQHRLGATLLTTPINMPQPLLTATPTASLLHYAQHSPHEQSQQQTQHSTSQHHQHQHQQQQQQPQPQQQHTSSQQQQQSPRDTPTTLTSGYAHNPYAPGPITYASYPTYPICYTTPHGAHILHTAPGQDGTGGPVLVPLYNTPMFNYMGGYMFPPVYNPNEYQFVPAAGPTEVGVGVPVGEAQVMDVNAQVQENNATIGATVIPTAGSMLQPQIWPAQQMYAAPAHAPGSEYGKFKINIRLSLQ